MLDESTFDLKTNEPTLMGADRFVGGYATSELQRFLKEQATIKAEKDKQFQAILQKHATSIVGKDYSQLTTLERIKYDVARQAANDGNTSSIGKNKFNSMVKEAQKPTITEFQQYIMQLTVHHLGNGKSVDNFEGVKTDKTAALTTLRELDHLNPDMLNLLIKDEKAYNTFMLEAHQVANDDSKKPGKRTKLKKLFNKSLGYPEFNPDELVTRINELNRYTILAQLHDDETGDQPELGLEPEKHTNRSIQTTITKRTASFLAHDFPELAQQIMNADDKSLSYDPENQETNVSSLHDSIMEITSYMSAKGRSPLELETYARKLNRSYLPEKLEPVVTPSVSAPMGNPVQPLPGVTRPENAANTNTTPSFFERLRSGASKIATAAAAVALAVIAIPTQNDMTNDEIASLNNGEEMQVATSSLGLGGLGALGATIEKPTLSDTRAPLNQAENTPHITASIIGDFIKENTASPEVQSTIIASLDLAPSNTPELELLTPKNSADLVTIAPSPLNSVTNEVNITVDTSTAKVDLPVIFKSVRGNPSDLNRLNTNIKLAQAEKQAQEQAQKQRDAARKTIGHVINADDLDMGIEVHKIKPDPNYITLSMGKGDINGAIAQAYAQVNLDVPKEIAKRAASLQRQMDYKQILNSQELEGVLDKSSQLVRDIGRDLNVPAKNARDLATTILSASASGITENEAPKDQRTSPNSSLREISTLSDRIKTAENGAPNIQDEIANLYNSKGVKVPEHIADLAETAQNDFDRKAFYGRDDANKMVENASILTTALKEDLGAELAIGNMVTILSYATKDTDADSRTFHQVTRTNGDLAYYQTTLAMVNDGQADKSHLVSHFSTVNNPAVAAAIAAIEERQLNPADDITVTFPSERRAENNTPKLTPNG